MKRILFLLASFIPAISYSQSCNGNLVWSDEFDSTALNLSKWAYQTGDGCPSLCGWGNSEMESYTNSSNNTYIVNGVLNIKAIKQTIGSSSFSSAKLITKGLYSRMYGRFEARMRMPAGAGLWPAFWMLNNTSNWPTSGEIDIMEYRGDQTNITQGTLHYGSKYPNNQHDGGSYNYSKGLDQDFHIYAVEWTADDIKWYFDGVLFKTETKSPNSLNPASNSSTVWPWNNNFYILLNLAVGGWFTGVTDANNVVLTKANFEIDYVRVYDLDNSSIAQVAYNGTSYPIPGKIECENYDIKCGGAYYDVDGSNNGGQYRTDGVDIENCTDAGGGYNVGYSDVNEWMEYTVSIAKAANYDVDLRLASGGNSSSSVSLNVDGTNVTGNVAVSNTGGWQTWKNYTVKNIPLTAGAHVVRWVFGGANVNANYMNWKESSNGIADVYPMIKVEDFSNRILFHDINSNNLLIYDIAGSLVNTHISVIGNSLQINKEDLPAGIYLYKINNQAGKFLVY
ncbi:MAG: family 16 glycosylhydrolase [Bacteroidetes bacterium]|nr:family 16 glycosylhydrolase [Bacteroidota bacterium]